jgi:ATP-dependent DNA helicase DinG
MARFVEDLIAGGGCGLVEAGTGTGKTLGYLVPAASSGRRVVVSTGTKNLQEQLFGKDLPLLRRLFPDFNGTLLKGRSNYLCRLRWRAFREEGFLPGSRQALFQDRLRPWAERTVTGDRSELEWLGDQDPSWREVSAEAEGCPGKRCPLERSCFVTQARRLAATARLAIVNHHLLLLERASSAGSDESFLEADLLVVDEAHLLEETATQVLGVVVGVNRLAALLGELGQEKPLRRGARKAATLLSRLPSGGGGRSGAQLMTDEERESFQAAVERLAGFLQSAAAHLAEGDREDPRTAILRSQTERLAQDLSRAAAAEESGAIFWHETTEEGNTCTVSPLEVASLLPDLLFRRYPSLLLTSATLAVGGSFRHLREGLGIPRAQEMIQESPFDHRRQSVLYLPRDLPFPDDPDYNAAAARAAIPILSLTGGRAFVLCTSRRAAEEIADILERETPFPILRQGSAPRTVLLERFRSRRAAVLAATYGFWQGVDVPGQDLSAVIIHKLPFAAPDEPLTAGRIRAIREAGGSPFMEHQLPRAVIMLKQGLGRLIRSSSDRGVLAVLDPRLRRRSYGRIFLESLPPMNVVDRLETLEEAYAALAVP